MRWRESGTAPPFRCQREQKHRAFAPPILLCYMNLSKLLSFPVSPPGSGILCLPLLVAVPVPGHFAGPIIFPGGCIP